MPDVLNVKQVAARFGVNERTLREWVSLGHFPKPIKINQRVHFWTPTMLDQWIAQKAEEAQS